MSIFSAVFGNQVKSLEQAFGARDITSSKMQEAVAEWFNLYFDSEPAENEDTGQRIAYAAVNKITKAVFSEYTANIPEEFANLDEVRKQAMQMTLVGGECFIKPILKKNGFDFAVVRRDCYCVLSRDMVGNVASIGTTEQTDEKGAHYTLVERRTLGEDGRLTVESRLYRSDNRAYLGNPVPLASLAKYERLAPTMTMPVPLYNLGMVHMKTPMANCVDGSHDGASIYAPAVGLIHNINRNEKQINDEFDNGASRIIASSDMITRDSLGRRKLSDKLFVGIDDDTESVGVTIFSPALRDQSYLARKNEYLRNIETVIGLKRGILSEVEAQERTATEVTSSEGDYNLTIVDFQQMWEKAAREMLKLCSVLGPMYKLKNIAPFDPEKDLAIDWGDGVLYNRDRTWAEYLQMVQAGMLKTERALAWYFELPCETDADLAKIRTEYMPELEAMAGE